MKQKKVWCAYCALPVCRLRLRALETSGREKRNWTKESGELDKKKTDTKEKSKPQRTCNETNPKTKQKRETKKSILSAGNVTVS